MKTRFRYSSWAGAVLLAAGLGVAFAQEPAVPVPAAGTKPAAASQRMLRLLPLGEAPPFEQEVKDGIRYELEPETGSIPPRQVLAGAGETAPVVRLNMNRISEAVRLPAGVAPVVLRAVAGTPDTAPTPWLTLRPPETGDVLALLWRDPKKPWSQARAMLLPDSAAALPAGRFRVINLLPVEAALTIDGKNELVAPGRAFVREVTVGKDLPFQVAYRDPTGKLKQFHSAAILLNAGERGQVLLYLADGKAPRRPARVKVISEIAPPVGGPAGR